MPSAAIVHSPPVVLIPTDVPRKRRGPPLRASPRGRFVLIETSREFLGLLSPRDAFELARELVAAAGEAGPRRAIAAPGDQCRRRAGPLQSWVLTRHALPAEGQR